LKIQYFPLQKKFPLKKSIFENFNIFENNISQVGTLVSSTLIILFLEMLYFLFKKSEGK
jgi:hypothetical protein